MDLGIGNGLRNKLTQAASTQDSKLGPLLVSTAYVLFSLLQGAFMGLFLILSNYVSWSRVLNSTVDSPQLRQVVVIVALAMAVKLVLDMLSYVLLALQESSRVNFINLLINGLVLIGTYGLSRFTTSNLVYLALVVGAVPYWYQASAVGYCFITDCGPTDLGLPTFAFVKPVRFCP